MGTEDQPEGEQEQRHISEKWYDVLWKYKQMCVGRSINK